MRETNTFLYIFFKCRTLYGKVKIHEEARECIKFANFCKAKSIEGSLSGIWCHIANETGDNSRKVFGSLLKNMGKLCGVSDYIFIGPKGGGCIEFKAELKFNSKDNGLTPAQKLFKKWCDSQKVPYIVVVKSETAINALKEWGLLEDAR